MLVGDHQHRDARLADFFQQLHHLQAQLGVDVAGGLVCDDQLGRVDQRPGHRHPLLFAARQIVGVAVGLVPQVDQLQHIGHTLVDLFFGDVGHVHGKGHVLVDGHAGDQAEVLEDDPHLPAYVGDLVFFQGGNVVAVDIHLALGGQDLAQDQLEQGGFARARVPQQKDELAGFCLEVDVLQGQAAALLVLHGHVLKIYHWYFWHWLYVSVVSDFCPRQ